MKSTHTSHGLIRKNQMLDMLANVPFENNTYSQPLECIVQIHKDEKDCVEPDNCESTLAINSAYVQKLIATSSLPGIGKACMFAPPTTEVRNALNTDFRLCSSLLHAVAILHTGSFIVVDEDCIFTLTAEVYARAKALDSHGETNLKSLPTFNSLYPNLLSVGIHEEADGGAAKSKLKIGSKSMNVLITMSTSLKNNKVFIGPETPINGFHKYALYYETTKQQNFVETIKNFFDGNYMQIPRSVSHLRQLSSGFDKAYTFSACHHIFTVADLPGNQGYGLSDNVIANTASNILQCVAIAVLPGRPLTNDDIVNVIDQYPRKNREKPAIGALLTYLETRVTTNPLDIATPLVLVSAHAHNSLSVANQKISENSEVKLTDCLARLYRK